MKGINFKFCLGIAVGFLSLSLSSCISIPNSQTPRFYAFSSVDGNQVSKKINVPSSVIIGVGPVKIPEYLDRPQMVTKNKEKMLQIAQFDRWGEALDLGLTRLVREDLTVMLPGAKLTLYPWNPSIPVKYQVVLEVVQLDSELNKDIFFVVQWTIIDVQTSKSVFIKRSEFRQQIVPPTYAGLAKTLSAACASLSGQIAETIASLK